MRKLIVLLLIFSVLFNLTGCGYLTGRTKEMISEYNMRVENTVTTYENLKLLAKEKQEDLYLFILGETNEFFGFTDIKDFNTVNISKGSHYVIRTDYFTSLDATALREVIILSGSSLIYVEVIWGTDGVISITRRVV